MAYIQCYFRSDALGKCCDMTILLPQHAPAHPEKLRGKHDWSCRSAQIPAMPEFFRKP